MSKVISALKPVSFTSGSRHHYPLMWGPSLFSNVCAQHGWEKIEFVYCLKKTCWWLNLGWLQRKDFLVEQLRQLVFHSWFDRTQCIQQQGQFRSGCVCYNIHVWIKSTAHLTEFSRVQWAQIWCCLNCVEFKIENIINTNICV